MTITHVAFTSEIILMFFGELNNTAGWPLRGGRDMKIEFFVRNLAREKICKPQMMIVLEKTAKSIFLNTFSVHDSAVISKLVVKQGVATMQPGGHGWRLAPHAGRANGRHSEADQAAHHSEFSSQISHHIIESYNRKPGSIS
jgi:hypothetical protein